MFVSFESFCFSFRRGCPSILEKVQCFGHSRHHFRPDVPVLLHLFVSEASGPVGEGASNEFDILIAGLHVLYVLKTHVKFH